MSVDVQRAVDMSGSLQAQTALKGAPLAGDTSGKIDHEMASMAVSGLLKIAKSMVKALPKVNSAPRTITEPLHHHTISQSMKRKLIPTNTEQVRRHTANTEYTTGCCNPKTDAKSDDN